MKVEPAPHDSQLPACAMLSRVEGPRMLLLGRLVDGNVFSWQFNQARSQLESESKAGRVSGEWLKRFGRGVARLWPAVWRESFGSSRENECLECGHRRSQMST